METVLIYITEKEQRKQEKAFSSLFVQINFNIHESACALAQQETFRNPH